MKKRYLYLTAAIIWGIPGFIIAIKGLRAYAAMPSDELWWLLLITAGVLAGFIIMFRRIVDRYCALIDAEPEKTTILHTFPLRGWILIVCMMSLGIALKFMPWIPAEFTASFYSGLGPALVIASVRFCKKFF
ncbi:MAG: hypothetical protein IJV28_03520 [Paludibacteraceae bacterium]|nr:hypothetical protein [Paludibacteraceae bacterium]